MFGKDTCMFWFLGPVLYNLYAVCYHSGTVNMGHYTACCRDEDGWWYYNDSRWGRCETFKFNDLADLQVSEICKKKKVLNKDLCFFFPQCATSPREPAPVKSGLCFVLPVREQWNETLRCSDVWKCLSYDRTWTATWESIFVRLSLSQSRAHFLCSFIWLTLLWPNLFIFSPQKNDSFCWSCFFLHHVVHTLNATRWSISCVLL